MRDIKKRLTAWYDAHIAAAWYRSTAMWAGILAGLVQFAPDWIQLLLDQFDLLGGVFQWTQQTKSVVQSVLLFIVLPAAKAWQQDSMRAAALKQAARTGQVSSPVGTDSVIIDVPGQAAEIVAPPVSKPAPQ